MKYTILFAAGAFANVLPRAISDILADISNIQDGTEALGQQVSGFSTVQDAPALISAVGDIVDAINQGDADVQSTGDLDTVAASQLITPVTNLGAAVVDAIDATVAKKQTFVSLGLGGEVENQLLSIQSAATTFSNDLVAAVPDNLSSIAQSLAGPIASALQSGVDAFSGLGSSAPGGGSSTTTASGSSSSSTPSSSGGSPPGYSSSASASSSASVSGTVVSPPPSYSSPASSIPLPSSTPVPYTGAAVSFVPAIGALAAVAAGVAAFAL